MNALDKTNKIRIPKGAWLEKMSWKEEFREIEVPS